MPEAQAPLFRVREEYKRNPSALWSPEAGAHIVPDPARQYTADDPMVKANPWYFIQEGQEEEPPPVSVRISDVEQATRAPGEKRTAPRRTRKPAE